MSVGENTVRELETQKEIMKQLEANRLGSIKKLKQMLDDIEAAHMKVLNEK